MSQEKNFKHTCPTCVFLDTLGMPEDCHVFQPEAPKITLFDIYRHADNHYMLRYGDALEQFISFRFPNLDSPEPEWLYPKKMEEFIQENKLGGFVRRTDGTLYDQILDACVKTVYAFFVKKP